MIMMVWVILAGLGIVGKINKTTLKFEATKTGLISAKDFDEIVDPKKMTYPG